MFFRTATFNRTDTLEAAHKAKSRGKRKKAIACYLKALEANTEDLVAHAKVAPLLAETKQYDKAWTSFRAAGEGFMKLGFYDKSIGVYRLAAKTMPKHPQVWESIIKLQAERGLKADAIKTTLTGYRHFKGKRTRTQAINLLKKGWGVVPWHREVTLELARLHAKIGKKAEALRLLDGLAERSKKRDLRKVRGAAFRIAPSSGTLWRWLRAAVIGA